MAADDRDNLVRLIIDNAQPVAGPIDDREVNAVREVFETINGAKPAPALAAATGRLKPVDGDPPRRGGGADGGGAAAPAPVENSEDALAQGAMDMHHEYLRYLPETGEWAVWDGARWLLESTDVIVRRRLRMYLRARSTTIESLREAKQIAGQRCLSNVQKLATTDPRVEARFEEFDADPTVLNTPGGLCDLRTGDLRPVSREDMVSQMTAVAPAEDAPTWGRCVMEWANDDYDMARFLQVAAGYAATGETREQVFMFFAGVGANGKSLFLKMLSEALGTYAMTAPPDLFVVAKGERHPTSLAGLRNKRLCVGTETTEGRALDDALVKSLVAADIHRARFIRQDEFEFTPKAKIILAGNHKPALKNVDKALRRRMVVVPFNREFTRPDLELPEKLRAELPGILGWIIDGAAMWYRRGLDLPKVVKEASDEYLDSEDQIGRWLAERCHESGSACVLTEVLFQDWTTWATAHGEFVGTSRRLAEALRNRGYQRWRDPGTGRRGFRGIGLGYETPAQAQSELDLGGGGAAAGGEGADRDQAPSVDTSEDARE
jgi:putative DNA primase/helicase